MNRIAAHRRDSIAVLHREWLEGKAAQYPPVPDAHDDEDVQDAQTVDRLMPTRLGNILREAEDRAGKRFGLDAVSFAGHFLAVAKPDLVAHYEDSRAEMDVAVRFVFVWAACTVIAIAAFMNDGPWLCVALGSYFLSWLSYRSALRAAS